MKEFKILLENVGGESNGIFNSFLIFIGPILGIFLQIITQNFIDNKKLSKEQVNIKKEEMKNELNDFYYPLLQLLRKNSIMHEVLIHEKSHDFRTLIELLKRGNLTSNDKAILKEIIEIDNEINI